MSPLDSIRELEFEEVLITNPFPCSSDRIPNQISVKRESSLALAQRLVLPLPLSPSPSWLLDLASAMTFPPWRIGSHNILIGSNDRARLLRRTGNHDSLIGSNHESRSLRRKLSPDRPFFDSSVAGRLRPLHDDPLLSERKLRHFDGSKNGSRPL
ncbi:hypothetical protein KFK09_023926 [Dendrobium nobile]|uniref:Uncharacterized protein n=1 Tax=Dendrobium nobile TaxID=94219 RepID=A0A8T3ACK8_DENNO|nr:hypothetical protein KFK09_023926 [Dendrobium nobile]